MCPAVEQHILEDAEKNQIQGGTILNIGGHRYTSADAPMADDELRSSPSLSPDIPSMSPLTKSVARSGGRHRHPDP